MWNQIYELAEKYNIRYTGLVIENYSDQVEGPFPRNRDTQRFQYFGNMLLRQGGEIGYHGYNHMPLCLVGFDYQGDYDSYNLWESYEDMVEAMRELHAFCTELFPEESFRVYVPPSNILSEEGRKMLAEEFPDLAAVASLYIPGDISYIQEFEVAEDGIVETPRIISGYIFEPDVYVAALSELNFIWSIRTSSIPMMCWMRIEAQNWDGKKCMEESVSIWSGCMILHPQSEI